MRRPRRPAQELRFAIECLPQRTRAAMLEAIDENHIIVGAYTDGNGGVCPMLAAHRRGGRTDLASFARAWDRYTRVGNRARPATDREMLTLRSMLQTTLQNDECASDDFAAAVADLKIAKARSAAEDEAAAGTAEIEVPAERPDSGERDRSAELRDRPGWSWLRVFRRYDEYEAALEQVRRAERDAERGRKLDRV